MLFTTVLPKLFVELFLLFLYIIARKTRKERVLTFFLYIILLLVSRDILFAIFKIPLIFSFSDFLVILIYLFWIRNYTGRRRGDFIFIIFNLAIFTFGFLDSFLSILNLGQYVFNLVIIADIIYMSLVLGLVSEYNTEDFEMIASTRYVLITAFSIFNVIALLYGYDNEAIQSIIVPLFYFTHAYILYRYIRFFDLQREETINFLQSNLESMFDFMKNFGNAITNRIDLDTVLELIVTSAVKNIGADAGTILMVDEFEDRLNVKATYGLFPPLYNVPEVVKVKASSLKRHFRETPIPLGETLLGKVAGSGEPVFIRNTSGVEELKNNTRNDILFVSSIIIVPLLVSGRILGVLSTVKRIENQFFSERDLEHLKTFADAASVTIDNLYTYMEVLEKREIEKEVDTAAEIQKKLLPSGFPEIPQISLAALNQPAKGVSGDYYDIFKLNDNEVGLFICDVAGKGVPAALVMVMIRTILRLIVASHQEPSTIVTWINRGITGSISIDHFATLSFLTYNRKNHEVVYSNAAHMPLLVFKKNEEKFVQVDTPGLPIGVDKNTIYSQKRFMLEEGDFIIMYTDGIVETMDEMGNQFTLNALLDVIKKNSSFGASEVVKKIRDELSDFSKRAKQHDDQTLLLMKVE